jgi:hypothetical protein
MADTKATDFNGHQATEIPQQNLCIVWKKPLDLMPMLEI